MGECMLENYDELTRTRAPDESGQSARQGGGKEVNGASSFAHALKNSPPLVQQDLEFTAQAISSFTDGLITAPEEELSKEFVGYLDDGYPVDSVFTGLLGAAANELGDRWERDICSFAEVTLGMAVMHRLLRRYSDVLADVVPRTDGNPAVFVTPIPGEVHIFASSLLSEHFRAAGWQIHSGIQADTKALVETVKQHHVHVVALTVSDAHKVKDAARLIQQMRVRSRNPDVSVLVGGPPFISDPALHVAVGADATAIDAMAALDVASSLVAV